MIPLQSGASVFNQEDDALGIGPSVPTVQKRPDTLCLPSGNMVHGVFTTLLFAIRALREVRAT
jgi:hypothetical protein